MGKIIISIYIITTSSALVILKLATKHGAPIEFINNRVHLNINLLTVSGIVLYGISFLTYMYLISKYNLGYIIPLATSIVYIIIFFVSFTFFKEVFTLVKAIGIALIVVGLIFLNLKR